MFSFEKLKTLQIISEVFTVLLYCIRLKISAMLLQVLSLKKCHRFHEAHKILCVFISPFLKLLL